MHKLNLIPKEVLKKQAKKKRYFACMVVIMILTVIFICSLVLVSNMKTSLEEDIKKISNEIAEVNSKSINKGNLQNIIKDYEKRQAMYISTIEDRKNYFRILNQIMSFNWENTVLYSLKMDDSNYLVIEGYALRNRDIAKVLEDVKTMDKISDATVGFIQRVETDNIGSGYHFEIMTEFIKD